MGKLSLRLILACAFALTACQKAKMRKIDPGQARPSEAVYEGDDIPDDVDDDIPKQDGPDDSVTYRPPGDDTVTPTTPSQGEGGGAPVTVPHDEPVKQTPAPAPQHTDIVTVPQNPGLVLNQCLGQKCPPETPNTPPAPIPKKPAPAPPKEEECPPEQAKPAPTPVPVPTIPQPQPAKKPAVPVKKEVLTTCEFADPSNSGNYKKFPVGYDDLIVKCEDHVRIFAPGRYMCTDDGSWMRVEKYICNADVAKKVVATSKKQAAEEIKPSCDGKTRKKSCPAGETGSYVEVCSGENQWKIDENQYNCQEEVVVQEEETNCSAPDKYPRMSYDEADASFKAQAAARKKYGKKVGMEARASGHIYYFIQNHTTIPFTQILQYSGKAYNADGDRWDENVSFMCESTEADATKYAGGAYFSQQIVHLRAGVKKVYKINGELDGKDFPFKMTVMCGCPGQTRTDAYRAFETDPRAASKGI